MKKRLDSMKLVDIAGIRTSSSPRQDSDNSSAKEYAISTGQTSASTSTELSITSTSTAVARASTSTAVARASTSTAVARASTSTAVARASTSTAVARASTFTAVARASKSFGYCFELESMRVMKRLSGLFNDFPMMSLPVYVDFGKLLTIAQRFVEFRPIIRVIFLLNRALPYLNIMDQKRVFRSVIELDIYINSLSQLNCRYDHTEMCGVYSIISGCINYIYLVLEKTHVLRCSPLKNSDFYVPLSEILMNFLLRVRRGERWDESFLRQVSKSQTDWSTHLDTRYLRNIRRKHHEFEGCVKTVLGVYKGMKYLSPEAQFKVYKSIYKIQEIIKELVLYKTSCDIYSFEKFIPVLINQIYMCFSELLEDLREQILPPRDMPGCEQCQTVSKYVMNVNVKPEDVERRPVTHQVGQVSAVEYANEGITQGRFRNLESVIHHLTAIREAAYMYTCLYQSRINWFEIARQYREYQTKAQQDLIQLGIWKDHSFWRLVELQDVVGEAQTFCDMLRGICYPRNKVLSDAIALGGELELLASEAEIYLTSLGELLGQFLHDWPKYSSVNSGLRRSRVSFLTKDQWEAFDFPN